MAFLVSLAFNSRLHVFFIRFSRIPIICQTHTWYLSYAIIAFEVIIPIMILIPTVRKYSLQIAPFLLIFFTMFILSKEIDSSSEPCMCGGILESLKIRQHIVFNLFYCYFNRSALQRRK
ncbi:MauE/DoxX family redox-associated membrane protein [Chryseotalea sanaruensis]|uniref:MauE/DoxX family redox-associated membrane protein n=1 Tax=Chryseotalea sanaruensis TaxID=2482724 RepID=UPI00351E738A